MSFTVVSSPHENGKALIKWSIIVFIILGLIAAAGVIGVRQIPPVSQQLPENNAPILVTLSQPQGYQQAVWFTEIPLEVEVYSEAPIARLELWANGELAAEFIPEDGTATPWNPAWTPGAAGTFNLFARAYDANGHSSTSNIVLFTAMDTAEGYFNYTVQADDTLESISEQFQVDLAAVQEANPETEFTSGAQIEIPIPQQQAPQVQSPPEGGQRIGGASSQKLLGEISFWVQALIGSSTDLPEAPRLVGNVGVGSNCSIQLLLDDLTEEAFGYFIYRSENGSDFTRITTLYDDGSSKVLYTNDYGVQGLVTYYAAAFNTAGESPSAPFTMALSELGCGNTETTPGLELHGSQLSVPEYIDSVYFYISINDGEWQRAPALDGWFLPVEDGQVDIAPLISGYEELPSNSSLRLEVWGWSGGELLQIGALETTLSSTGLFACRTPGSCLQGLGWTNLLTVYPEAENHQVEFTWSSDALGAESGIWQVSTQPFPENFTLTPEGLLLSGPAGNAVSGDPISGRRFNLDIGELAGLLAGSNQAGMIVPEIETNWLLSGLSLAAENSIHAIQDQDEEAGLVFYVRVIAMDGSQPVGSPSDPVTVYYQPETEQENPLVEYPVPPEIYDIEIVEFTPIIPPTLDWGCMLIKEIDYNTFVINYFSLTELPEHAYERYAAAMNSQTPICPNSYKGVGEKPWYESMWDFASGALTWVSETYNKIKEEVVSTIASALDALPLIECGSGCEDLLMQGLNAGMVALGIPPELPNLEQLTDQGMDYLIELAAAEAGIDCDESCREIIRDGIQDFVEQSQQATVDAVCTDTEYAHSHGKEPLCLPEGITAIPAPGSVTQPATVTVQITRRPGTEDVDELFLSQYTYVLNFQAESYQGTDHLNVQVNTGFYEGSYSVTSFSESLPIEDPLHGPLFMEMSGPIPDLAPGEDFTITFGLQPADYWIPGHKDLIAAEGGFVRYNDFWRLYYGAELEITGSIICPWYDEIYQPTIECGGGDTLEYTIP